MSDRRAWLEEWCPQCQAAPGRRCGERRLTRDCSGARTAPLSRLHVARGWRARRCPTCRAGVGEPCRTPSGREASRIHSARLGPSRVELFGTAVWDELDREDLTVAVVPFVGRAGRGGEIGPTRVSRRVGGALCERDQWTPRDELGYALEAPIWDRYGSFAGHPLIRGLVTWNAGSRLVVISGTRGDVRFAESVR